MINKSKLKATSDVTKDSIVEHFISVMDDKFPAIKIKGVSHNRMIEVYTSIGQYIRNNYGLWLTTNPLTKPFFEDNSKVEYHPDEVSMDIVKGIWCKLNETWPFYDYSSGGFLSEDRYYAFSDSGGFAGKFYGYDNELEAAADLKKSGYTDDDWSMKPDDLGAYVAVLTGRQFIDQLYIICDGPEQKELFSSYGEWFKPSLAPAQQAMKV